MYLIETGKKWKAICTASVSRDLLTFELYADAHDGSSGLTVMTYCQNESFYFHLFDTASSLGLHFAFFSAIYYQ